VSKIYTPDKKRRGSKRRTYKGEDQGRVLVRFLNDDGIAKESRDRIARLVKLAQTAATAELLSRNQAAIEFNALAAQYTARPFCVVSLPVEHDVTPDGWKKPIKAKPLTTRFDLAYETVNPADEGSAFYALFPLAQKGLIGSVCQCVRCQKWLFARNDRHRFCSDECSEAWYAADNKEKEKRNVVSQQRYWMNHWYLFRHPEYRRLTWQEFRKKFLSLEPKPRPRKRP
jgi:hypothetical protein